MDSKTLSKKTGKTRRYIDYLFSGERRASAELAVELEKITGVGREAWLWPEKYPNPYIKNQSLSKA